MDTRYAHSIYDALTIADPRDSIERIKSTVIAELEEFDSRIRIKSTEYFNHTFSPDLVASWPHDPSISDRYIYLRYSSQPEYLLEDVSLVADHQPIIFSLNEPFEPSYVDSQIAETSLDSNTLVTDADGIEQFIRSRSSQFIELISTAVAQGGRGFVDRPVAAASTRDLASGFDGALSVEQDSTRRAAETIESLLTHDQAGRVMRLLQAVWVGAGGRMEDFPGPRRLGGDIADDALQFLLEYKRISEADFWRRLGQKVDVAQLSRMNLPEGSPNLDEFMRSNRDILWARSCRVKREQDRLDTQADLRLQWLVEASLLTLRGTGFSAYIGENAESISKIKIEGEAGIGVNELIRRAEDVTVSEVELSVGDKHINFASDDAQDIAQDETLADLVGAMGPEVKVKRVGITLPNVRHISCDFATATASARTNSKINLSELLMAAIPVLKSIPSEQKQELRDLLSFNRTEAEQIPLL